MDPQSPRFQPDEKLSRVILRIYERLDTFLGQVMDRADDETLILVVSDHGFTGAGVCQASLNCFLEARGWLQRRRHPAGLIKQSLLRGIPAGWRYTLARHFPTQVSSLETMARFGGIRWAHTRAWSEELTYFPSVRLNVSGRDPDGIIPPQHYRDIVLDLCSLLETWEPVGRAIPRWDVYHGPAATLAPDILIEPAEVNGYPWSFGRWRSGPPVRTISPDAYAGGREQGFNGVHRNPAFLAMNACCRKPSPGLIDIAPTVLAVLGLTAPHMEGSNLLASFPASSPPPDHGLFPETADIQRHLTPEEEAKLEERLRRMGYLE